MATGAEAIERLAKATGRLPSAVFRLARVMRETDSTLWPAAGKGGGKSGAHVEPEHLVALAIAVAVADPIAAAPRIVTGYRDMVWNTVPAIKPEHRGHATGLLEGARLFRADITAGELLAELVDLLAGQPDVANTLRAVGWRADVEKDPRIPRIVVRYIETDLQPDDGYAEHRFILRPRDTPVGLSRNADPAWNFLKSSGTPHDTMLLTMSLLVRVFVVLAELWGDTQRHHRKTISLPATASAAAAPEHDAATLQEVAASHLINQSSAERKRPRNQTPRTLRRSVAALEEE
jgi:hypothetical protein